MIHLNLQTANAIGNRALAVGREIKAAPLTVAVLDAGGHLISLQREDGASLSPTAHREAETAKAHRG